MEEMFSGHCGAGRTTVMSFNQDISTWNTSSVTNMHGMFMCCQNFRGTSLGAWDSVSASTRVEGKTYRRWDTSSVTTISRMFKGAWKFKADISAWDTWEAEQK